MLVRFKAKHLAHACESAGMLPQVLQLVVEVWQKDGLIKKTDSPFLREAARILKNSLELVVDADKQLRELLDYPLAATMAEDKKAQAVLDDNFSEVGVPCLFLPSPIERRGFLRLRSVWLRQVAETVVAAHESGELASALASLTDLQRLSEGPGQAHHPLRRMVCIEDGMAAPGSGGGGARA